MSKFKLKDNEEEEVEISKDEIEEIVPDADFRFSLVVLKTGEKHFVAGTKKDIQEAVGIAYE
ncbi:hypothetical protein ACFP1I_27795 [Dyadobacter subterraneus]|uniref:Uncharacterized protein n=1 Tax=Dyadobacter subterraneus TaxID=2773304 RepID=A0ABR9WCG3_9BACT|nr:hypothetical protein [Dyadobacter subterraneus]MBE9463168.1 hypothetical protein [Dyadobacter subterraneus]